MFNNLDQPLAHAAPLHLVRHHAQYQAVSRVALYFLIPAGRRGRAKLLRLSNFGNSRISTSS